MKNPLRSHAPMLAIGAIAVSLSAAGTVTAKSLIDGGDIKNESITSKDLRNRSVFLRDIALDARRSLQGADWSSGAGAPTPGKGRSGDWYLDTTTGDAFERRTSGWERRVNLKGAIGPAGATGPAGTKGGAGDRGPAGAEGESGRQGSAGDRGATGPKGSDGDDGQVGPRGATGLQGAPGVDGKVGESGARGATGPQGLDGKDGERGAIGPRGATGTSGTDGAPGERGAIGPQGDPGKDGQAGERGPAGPQGDPGKVGQAGVRGPAGPQGDAGKDGEVGPRGATGTIGLQGADGKPGPKGEAGEVGPQGPAGKDGERGTTGAVGATGNTGARGTRWLKGAGAPEPSTGAEGDWYLSTTTFDAYEKTSTGWQPVVNLRGPAGKDGAKGADGKDGAKGADGNTVLNGSGTPAVTLGRDGDYYIDNATTKLYGPKATTWGPGLSLVGPAGSGGGTSGGATLLVQAQVSAEQTPASANGSNLPSPLSFGDEVVDTGDSWNGTTFKAPADGLYLVQAQTVSKDNATPNNTTGHYLQLDVNGTIFGSRTILGAYPTVAAANFPSGFKGRSTFNGTLPLASGETIQLGALSANSSVTNTVDDRPLSRITIIKLG